MAVLDELVAILGFDLRGENQARRYQATLGNMDRGLTNVSNRAVGVGRVLTGLFVALGAARVIDGAVSFEEAMADVNKVVDATPAQMDALSDAMLRMSRELPVSAEGLASIAAEAGAAGVALEDLEAFTRQVAVAVTAFDLPAEQVGEIMAKLGNVFDFTVDDMGLFNDTINHLSNNMAAKAGELLNFTNRAAGAAKFLGVTADQLAGIGAALIAAGVVPETAARGLNALATRIQTDAKGVDEALQSVGLTTAQMQQMLAEDGDGALVQLFESLSELDVSEQATALKALVGQDFSDDFSKLTNNPDLLAQALGLANDEAGKLGSAQQEYNTRAETTRAKWQRTKGIMASVGIIAAGPLLDGFGRVADKVFEITEAIDNAETNAEALQAVASALGFELSAEQAQAIVDTLTVGFEVAGAAVDVIRTSLGQSLTYVAGEYVPAMLAHWERIKAAFGLFDLSGWIDLINQLGLVDTATGVLVAGVSAAIAIFNSFSEMATTATGVVLAGLSDLSEGSVISGLVERLSGLGETVTAVFDKLSTLFGAGGAGEGLATTLGDIIGKLTVLFVEIMASKLLTVAELVVTAIDTIVTALGRLMEGDVVGAVSALFEGFGSALEIVGTHISSVVESLGLAGTAFEQLSTFASTAMDVVRTALSDSSEGSIMSGLIDRLGSLRESVSGIFEKISELFTKLGELFGAGGAGEGLATTLGNIVGALTVLFVEILGASLVTVAELVVTAIDTIVTALGRLMEGDVVGAVSALFDGLSSVVGVLGGHFMTVFQAIDGLVERIFGLGLSDIFANLIQSAKDAGVAIKDAFFQIMSGLGDYLKGAILTGVESALNYAVTKINQMIDGLNVALGYVGGEIDKLETFNLTDTGDGGNASPEARDSVHRSTLDPDEARRRMQLPVAERIALARQDAIDSQTMPIPVDVTVSAPVAAPTPQPVPVAVEQSAAQPVVDLTPLASAVDNLAAASAATVDIDENAPRLVEQTTNTDNTRNITNQVTNNTTVNQTVTGPTAASSAATATQRAAQRGTDRGLTVSNQGPQ